MWNFQDCIGRVIIRIFLICGLLFIATFARSSTSVPSYPTDRFIVKFHELDTCANDILTKKGKFADFFGDRSDSIDLLNKQYKVSSATALFSECQAKRIQKPGQKNPLKNVYIFKVPKGTNIEEVTQAYSADDHVAYAQPDHAMKLAALQIPDAYIPAWSLAKINAPAAWQISQGQDVVVAVIDTGVDFTQPDLQGHFWTNPLESPDNGQDDDNNGYIDDIHGFDFVNTTGAPIDTNGHGTRVAGIISGALNTNGAGGVAPLAKLMILKGFDSATQQGNDSALAQAMIYAADNGAKIINSSWYYPTPCPTNALIEQAVKYAYQSGALVIFAAGDNNDDVLKYSPNNMKEIMAVSSTASDDMNKVASSNFGMSINVAAPGVNILSPTVGGIYDYASGTSLAAAHISGVAALIASQNPSFSNEEIRQTILASSTDISGTGFSTTFGHGRVDAAKALQVAAPLVTQITAPANNFYLDLSSDTFDIQGSAFGHSFTDYRLEYRVSGTIGWDLLAGPFIQPVQNNLLAQIPSHNFQPGIYDLRVTANSNNFEFFDITRIQVLAATPFIHQITSDIGDQLYPSISGDWMAWGDNSYGQTEITAYNIKSKKQQRLTFNPASKEMPSVDGNTVVWEDRRNGTWDIYGYDLAANQELPIVTLPGNQRFPSISNNKIVYQDDRNGGADIYLYNLNTRTEQRITTAAGKHQQPKIWNNIIVWADSRNGNWDIYMYDLNTLLEKQISTATTNDTTPNVASNIIVWQESVANWWQIFMYDVTTQVTTQLTSDAAHHYAPSISGNKIVWRTSATTGKNIIIYDLTAKTSTPITQYVFNRGDPVINNNNIAWSERRNNNADIFLFKENHPPVLNALSDKTVTANQPLSFTVSASDEDNDKLTMIAKQQNGDLVTTLGAQWTDQGNGTATFEWTPPQAGSYFLVFSAADPLNAIASQMITITVTAPVVIVPPPPPVPQPTISKLLEPTAGTVIKDEEVKFIWEKVKNVKAYGLKIGTSVGSGDIFNKFFKKDRTHKIIKEIPLNGKPVYVRLYTCIDGKWLYMDYVYQTQKPAKKTKSCAVNAQSVASLSHIVNALTRW
ncbi:MAG: S8 family serine peptidase [Candidatus Omnitrophica bacterium]|nr:S8 family serine peptidase [Candidatus Omnitrophota bacterium]